MSTIDIIYALEATNSRLEKEKILTEAFLSGERTFFLGARMAFDKMITYGIKKAPYIEDDETDEGPFSFNFDNLVELASKLETRQLTGHAARDALIEAADNSNIAEWNGFFRRILLKDLKCGVDVSTTNKVLLKIVEEHSAWAAQAHALLTYVFSCQLAKDGSDPAHTKKVAGRKLLDAKLDGVRLLTVLDKELGRVIQYTREGKPNENFTEITTALTPLLDVIPVSMVLDGEVVSKSFQDLMRQVNRRSDVDTSLARLAVFDIVPKKDFFEGKCDKTQEERHGFLVEMQEQGHFQITNGLVYVIPKLLVDLDTDDGQKTFAEFNKTTVEAGYEGIMVKDPLAPYVTRRTASWLKVKPFIEVSLTVVGVDVGKEEGKRKGLLGALVCEGEDDGKFIKVNVGGGFTDKQVREFWEDQSLVMGMIVEVRADAFSQEGDNIGTNNYSLRFPRFKGFRGTVPGEKL